MTQLRNVTPPNLPIAPTQYDRRYLETLTNVLRLFLNELSNRANWHIADLTPAQVLELTDTILIEQAGRDSVRATLQDLRDLTFGDYWTDLVIEGTAINPPGAASDPVRSSTTGLLEFSGTQDNVITGCWQMPHGWAGEFGSENSIVKPHLHVRNLTANTDTSRWKFEYDVSSAAGNMTNAYGTFTTLGTVSHVNPNDTTQISIVSLGDLDLSGAYGASTLIHFRISRLASSDAADTDTSVIALYSMDLHYQVRAAGTETVVPSGL